MRQLIWHHILMIAVAGLVLFTNLGRARLWDQDEPRNAGCAREMLQRGDWIVPTFNNELRTAKPVLLYWLIMSAYMVLGVNELAARFWCAILGVGTVIATYHIGRRLFKPRAALWGAIALATSIMFDVAGRAATPDSPLIFCSTTALLIYVLATFAPQTDGRPRLRHQGRYYPQSWKPVAAMYAVMGVGVLAKGPVAVVLPTAVIGMFLLVMTLPPQTDPPPSPRQTEPTSGRRKWIVGSTVTAGVLVICVVWGLLGLLACVAAAALWAWMGGKKGWMKLLRPFAPRHVLCTAWSMRPLTACAAALVVALPWYVAVGVKTDGVFLREFFINEHFGRATTAMENHTGSPLFYPAAILAGFFPWSVFMAPLILGLWRRVARGDVWKPGYVLMTCWVGVYVALFTLAATKLPSYVTPCYPALALLAGCFVFHWIRGTLPLADFWLKLAFGALAAVGVVMLVAIPVAAHQYLPGDEWLGAVGFIPIVGAALCQWLRQRTWRTMAARAMGACALGLTVVLFGYVTVRIDRHRHEQVFWDMIARRSADPQIACFGPLEPSWVFYSGRPIRSVTLDGAPQAEASGDWSPPPPVALSQLFAADQEAFLITPKSHLGQLASRLPSDVGVLASTPYFLKDEQLVLLGRLAADHRAARRPPRDPPRR